jgi:hypothetical protein
MRTLLVALTALMLFATPAVAGDSARDFYGESIQVIDKSATMISQRWVGVWATGPVGSDGIPEIISVGDVITVKNKTLVANVIIVTKVLKDMKWKGQFIAQKGDIYCTIAQTNEDIPGDEQRERLWISVGRCMPLQLQ